MQHVAGENQPEKGSDDQTVLEHAKKINQTIVTDNHDLIVLCARPISLSSGLIPWIRT